MPLATRPDPPSEPREGSTDQVVSHVRALIVGGKLKPGGRLPAERELAVQIGVSRPTVRAGLRALAAMGVVVSRHGSGTYIPSGPPKLGSAALGFLAALHGFTREEMYEARTLLEVGAAGMAAERAAPEQIAAMAEEVANLFSAMNDPQAFLVHDIDFHRSVAAASRNPIIAAVMEMISSLYYERRRETAARATQRNLRDAAEMHRRVYQAIRAGSADAARAAMSEHLSQSSSHQAQEVLAGNGSAVPTGENGAQVPRRGPSRQAARRRAPAKR